MPVVLHLYPDDARARRALWQHHGAWLRERGVALVLADDAVADSDRELYAATLELPPPEQVGAALEQLLEFARGHPLDGVLAQTESSLPAGSLLGHALSLPGPAPEAALRCVGKHLTRRALAAAGVAQPAFALASDSAAVRRFAREHGYPLMVKAVASTMSRLVTRIDGPGVLDAAVARVQAGLAGSIDIARFAGFARAGRIEPGVDPRTTFLVESFAPGDPVETDGFVLAGRARAFGVIEQVMTPPPRFFIEAYLLPGDRPAAERAAIQATGERAAQAVGLEAAGFSIELRAVGGAAQVIEVNGRLGQDDGLYQLFAGASQVDPFRLAIEVALGASPEYASVTTPRRALAYQCRFADGVVAAVPAAVELDAGNQDGIQAGLCVQPGDATHAPPHPETFPHLAWALASDPESSRRAHVRAREFVGQLRFGFGPRS